METLAGFPNPRHLPPALPPPRYARPRAMVRAEQSSAAPHAFVVVMDQKHLAPRSGEVAERSEAGEG